MVPTWFNDRRQKARERQPGSALALRETPTFRNALSAIERVLGVVYDIWRGQAKREDLLHPAGPRPPAFSLSIIKMQRSALYAMASRRATLRVYTLRPMASSTFPTI